MKKTATTGILEQPLFLSEWRKASSIFGVSLIVLFILYLPTASSMVDIWWRSGTYAHGFVIPLISGYLIWGLRHQLARVRPYPEAWGLLLLFGLSVSWFIADSANILFLTQLILVAMTISLAWTLLGNEFMRVAMFPMAFLIFAVPLGEDLVPILMDITAKLTVGAIKLTGIPIYYEGRYISLPTGNWEVARACSGVRYLIASVSLGCVYAYLTYRKLWKRLLFIAFSIVVPILANSLRAFGIVMLGHFSDMKIAVGVDHIIYGWVFFGLVIFLLFWIGSFWRDDLTVEGTPESHIEGVRVTDTQRPASGLRLLLMGVASILTMSLGTVFSASSGYAPDLDGYREAFPKEHAGWQGPINDAEPWNPVFPGATIRNHKVYKSNRDTVRIYLVYFSNQIQGKELISSTNSLYDPDVWRRISETTKEIELTGNRSVAVNEIVGRLQNRYRVLWYWYDISGKFTSNVWVGKYREAISKLLHTYSGSTLIAIAADYQTSPSEARDLLSKYLEEMTEVTIPGALLEAER